MSDNFCDVISKAASSGAMSQNCKRRQGALCQMFSWNYNDMSRNILNVIYSLFDGVSLVITLICTLSVTFNYHHLEYFKEFDFEIYGENNHFITAINRFPLQLN